MVTDLQGCGVGGGRQGRPPQAWSCWQDGKTRGFGCLGPCWFPVARAALPVAATGGRKRTSCRLPGREPEGDISPGRKLGVWGRQIPGLLQGQGPDSRSGVAEGVLSAARDASVTRGDLVFMPSGWPLRRLCPGPGVHVVRLSCLGLTEAWSPRPGTETTEARGYQPWGCGWQWEGETRFRGLFWG